MAQQSREEVFNEIYKNKVWGNNAEGAGFSGGGSTLRTTEGYRQFLQNFFIAYDIHSVIDAGCGDWEFSRTMNWDKIDYLGYDIVGSVIAKNQANYTAPNIHFIHGDIISMDLPRADLLICKDVLQHLPNEDILLFMQQLKKFKYCLIVNDFDANALTSSNSQVACGDFRFLDLTQPPFSLKGEKIFTFPSHPRTKQVLLITPKL